MVSGKIPLPPLQSIFRTLHYSVECLEQPCIIIFNRSIHLSGDLHHFSCAYQSGLSYSYMEKRLLPSFNWYLHSLNMPYGLFWRVIYQTYIYLFWNIHPFKHVSFYLVNLRLKIKSLQIWLIYHPHRMLCSNVSLTSSSYIFTLVEPHK